MSFEDFEWDRIDPNLNILVGPNGSGKTNFFNAFRLFADLFNDRSSSEIVNGINDFAHLGNQKEPITISMKVEFEKFEREVILAFFRASLINTLSNKNIPFDSVDDEKVLTFLIEEDMKEFFEGELKAVYDFYNRNWNIRYGSKTFLCLIEGNYSSYILDTSDGKGLLPSIREKFIDFIKVNFKEEKLQRANLEQITTSIQFEEKNRMALNLSIQSNHNNMKSVTIFKNLMGHSNQLHGYSSRNLFGWLLKNAFVFTDNIRELPKSIFTSKEIDDENEQGIIHSENIAYVLNKMKNGSFEERARFKRINSNFKDLTEGLDFDITAKHQSSPIQLPRSGSVEGILASAGQERASEDKRDITLAVHLQVIKDGHEFPLRYSGAGTWEALYFACLMEARGNIFLLDEPVANVHPTRQNLFSKKFQKNTEAQVFISTHSPYIAGLDDIQKISRLEFDAEKKTTVRYFCPEKMDSKTIEIVSRTKATISSLFSKAVILVEGETEAAALPKWFRDRFKNTLDDRNIVLISVGSKDSFYHYLRLINGFNIPWAILCD
ncbi:MAG TPA: AAA family ATPase, partial [bacterium]|nr:AAA family ATPase [bacterium]